jgi:uncharacterized membrane protein
MTSKTAGLLIAMLGLVGVAISGYITFAHYREVSTLCLPGMDCDAVLSSRYARIGGVPLSLFGLGMYLVLTALGWMLWGELTGRQGLVALGAYAIALAATLYTLYLYYLEIFVIEAFCTWCVASSVVVFALMALTSVNLRAAQRESRRSAAAPTG